MSKPTEKKTIYTPEQNLQRGITNRSIDCIRAYLTAESGKTVIFSPDAKLYLKNRVQELATHQDAKYAAVQTAFGHPKNWNVDFVASRAAGKKLRIFVPIKKVPKVPKPAKVKAAVAATAHATGKGKK
jgi:hypothetical protein